MIRKNDEVKLKIESITSEGNGIGHCDALAVFVPETAPGDEILCKIVKLKKSYAYGKVSDILTPSPHRCEPDCCVYRKCGGCSYRHISYEEELKIKQRVVTDAVQRIGKIDCEINPIKFTGETKHYRNKAQYPIREVNGQITAGFFAQRSHRVTDCDDCLLEPEDFSKIVQAVKYFATENKIRPYDESTAEGILRHIYLRRSNTSGEIHLCLVINAKGLSKQEQFVRFMTCAFPQISGISLNINTADTNVILGKETRVIYGRDYITDTLLGRDFRISPESFYQVNHDATEILYSEVKKLLALQPGETLIDMYCGIGTIGLCAADSTNRLIGVEAVPQAIENARKNAEINEIKNAEFYCSTAADMSAKLRENSQRADAVIIDPPRKGIDSETAHNIVSFEPKRIVYVSCNPATLARDLAQFESLGYKTVSITPVDMFPRTTHVESVALIIKI